MRFWRRENLPGYFPSTAVPFKREGEDPARMFAGEGGPSRTNRRFKLLSSDGERKIMIASLRYLDTYSKVDGAWYFAERKLIVDWMETRTSIAA